MYSILSTQCSGGKPSAVHKLLFVQVITFNRIVLGVRNVPGSALPIIEPFYLVCGLSLVFLLQVDIGGTWAGLNTYIPETDNLGSVK